MSECECEDCEYHRRNCSRISPNEHQGRAHIGHAHRFLREGSVAGTDRNVAVLTERHQYTHTVQCKWDSDDLEAEALHDGEMESRLLRGVRNKAKQGRAK